MDILDHVTQSCVPREWRGVNSPVVTREDYTTNRYRLFDLTTTDEEYIREIEPFGDGNLNERVTQMQRVQNPFHLGRFLLRGEQRRHRNIPIKERKYYHPIKNQSQLVTALEYNMDVRRYGEEASDGQKCPKGKNPCFYKTPREAFDAIPNNNCQYIIICNIFNEEEQNVVFKPNDTDYMPVYVVKLVN